MSASERTSEKSEPIDTATRDILDFVISFTSLSKANGRLRVRRSVGDVMHTLGYYAEQGKRDGTTADRLRNMAIAIQYIADHLDR